MLHEKIHEFLKSGDGVIEMGYQEGYRCTLVADPSVWILMKFAVLVVSVLLEKHWNGLMIPPHG